MLDYGITSSADLNGLTAPSLDPIHTDNLYFFDTMFYASLYTFKTYVEDYVKSKLPAPEFTCTYKHIYKYITPTEFFYQFEFGEQPKTGRDN